MRPVKLAKKLKEVREHADLSQDKLGARAGIAPDTVARLERGERGAHLSTIEKLAGALDVAPEELVDSPEELTQGKGDALSILSVKHWLRERDAGRFSYGDRTYVREYITPAREDGIEAFLEELRALTEEYRVVKDLLLRPSQLSRAVRQRRSDLRRDVRRAYWRRVRWIDQAAASVIDSDPNRSDEAREKMGEDYDRRATEIRRAA